MANFDADTLRELREVQEVRIRTEKHPKSAVVIWVVVADDEVFVRSWLGDKGRWYRDLATGGPATLEFAGHRLAHVADTEISHLHRPSPLFDFRRARSCHRPAPLARRGFAGGPIHVLQ